MNSRNYPGDAANFDPSTPFSINTPASGDSRSSSSVREPTERLADGVEGLRQRTAGMAEFSDGSDGAATFDGVSAVSGWNLSGGTYTALRHTHFTDVSVSTGVTLYPSGFGMWVNGTLTLVGTAKIDASGGDASGQTGGAVPASGIWYGGAGADGGNASTVGGNASLSNSVGGSGGVGGTSDDTHAGGTVTNTAAAAEKGSLRTPMSFGCGMLFGSTGCTVPTAGSGGSGGGGGGGGTKGGGGGAGGGFVLVMARVVNFSASCAVWAKGGIGGNGQVGGGFSAGGGGGGGGGVVLLGYNRSIGAAAPGTRVSVAGGAGGTGHAAGATGSNGLALVRVINP